MRSCTEANPAQANTCIIHDGMEGLAGTQCPVRGQTVGSVCPMVTGMAQPKPKPRVLMRLGAELNCGRAKKHNGFNEREKRVSFSAFGDIPNTC